MTTDTKREQRFARHKSGARGLAMRALVWMIFSLVGIVLGLLVVFGQGGVSLMVTYVAAAGLIAGGLALGLALWRQRIAVINGRLDQEDARVAAARSRFY